MKLYDVPFEFAELESLLVESAGELSPELEQRFDAFLRAGKDKIEAGAMVVGFEIEADACKQEAKRLVERSGGAGEEFGPAEEADSVCARCVSFDLIPGTDLATLPENCVRVTRALAADAVKQMMKPGETLPEEIIVTKMPGTRYLRIK